jgi:hypothetical protein
MQASKLKGAIERFGLELSRRATVIGFGSVCGEPGSVTSVILGES